jgi:hypothetical protein
VFDEIGFGTSIVLVLSTLCFMLSNHAETYPASNFIGPLHYPEEWIDVSERVTHPLDANRRVVGPLTKLAPCSRLRQEL